MYESFKEKEIKKGCSKYEICIWKQISHAICITIGREKKNNHYNNDVLKTSRFAQHACNAIQRKYT